MPFNQTEFNIDRFLDLFKSANEIRRLAIIYRGLQDAEKVSENQSAFPKEWFARQIFNRFRGFANSFPINVCCQHIDFTYPKFHIGEMVKSNEGETVTIIGLFYPSDASDRHWRYKLYNGHVDYVRHEDALETIPHPESPFTPLTVAEQEELEFHLDTVEGKYGEFLPAIAPESEEEDW